MNNRAKAQEAVNQLKETMFAEIDGSSRPISHAELVERLGIPSDYEGKNRNYLSWSILGLLVNEGKVRYCGSRNSKVYYTRDCQLE